jgi:hypothetical protein
MINNQANKLKRQISKEFYEWLKEHQGNVAITTMSGPNVQSDK